MRSTLPLALFILLGLCPAAPAQAPQGGDDDLAAAGWKPEVFKTVGDVALKL